MNKTQTWLVSLCISRDRNIMGLDILEKYCMTDKAVLFGSMTRQSKLILIVKWPFSWNVKDKQEMIKER